MNIKQEHPEFKMPTLATDLAGGYDVYMPVRGNVSPHSKPDLFPLGFSANVPKDHVALLLPRSSTGHKEGLVLANTCGIIDADYIGQWYASIYCRYSKALEWEIGQRIVQFLLVHVSTPELTLVDELEDTKRGAGAFGHSGKN